MPGSIKEWIGFYSQKHNNVCISRCYNYSIIRRLHVSAYSGHHQVSSNDFLTFVYIICVPGGRWRDFYIGPLLLLSIWYIGWIIRWIWPRETPLSIRFLVKVVSGGFCDQLHQGHSQTLCNQDTVEKRKRHPAKPRNIYHKGPLIRPLPKTESTTEFLLARFT
jgi:hypothetical protein